jgi:PAS domain S-box-containing protein
MAAPKTGFLDKVLGRLVRLDSEGLQSVVQRLARERSFLETLFNTIEDGVLVVDEHGHIIYFNEAVTRLIGLKPGSEGVPVTQILGELDWEKISRFDAEGGRHAIRHEFEVAYPRPRFLRLYAAPLDGSATGSAGVALILHDATEARQQAFEAIESERIQALTLLAASVAHELGNPLNALHIHLQLMERELKKLAAPAKAGSRRPTAAAGAADTADAAEKLSQYLAVATGEISRLDYIITQFLHAIRPAPPKLTPAQLNEVVTKTLELLRPELENRGIALKEKLARQLPLAPADAAQLQQALVNLIKNAMQAMSRGGSLSIATGESSEGVWVSVTDTGCGIPDEQLKHIFEPFYTTKKKGTGLGLMIVQRIVRAHNGRIEVDSRTGRGTMFRIWLPLHERKPRLLEAPVSSE